MDGLSQSFIQRALAKFGNRTSHHFHWSFDGQEGAHPLAARAGDFRMWFDPVIERKDYSFRAEVRAACERLDRVRKNRKIALCYTGGIDSELIALTLAELGIPFDLYFLDIWGLNREAFAEWSAPFLRKIGKTVQTVRLERSTFYEEHSLQAFSDLGCELPTYLCLTYLFRQIPSNQFLMVGDGDLNRSGSLYSAIGREHPRAENERGLVLPFSVASVAYHLWARKYKRAGEFYFFRSTPELIAAAITDPAFQVVYPQSSTREVIYSAFPEIERRPKTTNWDSAAASRENSWIRNWIQQQAGQFSENGQWSPALGALVRVDGIFRN